MDKRLAAFPYLDQQAPWKLLLSTERDTTNTKDAPLKGADWLLRFLMRWQMSPIPGRASRWRTKRAGRTIATDNKAATVRNGVS